MALLVGGQVEAAERRYAGSRRMQRADGSWPMKIVAGEVEDDRGEVNMSAYLAVGVWHHWLVRRDRRLRGATYWPSVRAGLDFVVGLQLPFGGGIQWTPVDDFCLLAGSRASTSRCAPGVALADLLGRAAARVGAGRRPARPRDARAPRPVRRQVDVLDGLVLPGPRRRGPRRRRHELLATRWDDFVVPGLGIRCVDTNPWVTGAETCELAMALDAIGDHERALKSSCSPDMQHLREDDGLATGPAGSTTTRHARQLAGPRRRTRTPLNVHWPVEHTTYTAAAVILAVDALGEPLRAQHPRLGDHARHLAGAALRRDRARVRRGWRPGRSRRRTRPSRPSTRRVPSRAPRRCCPSRTSCRPARARRPGTPV
jgi:hypothetical protein